MMDATELTKLAAKLRQTIRDDPGDPQNKVLATMAVDVGLMVISDLHRVADALETLADNDNARNERDGVD